MKPQNPRRRPAAGRGPKPGTGELVKPPPASPKRPLGAADARTLAVILLTELAKGRQTLDALLEERDGAEPIRLQQDRDLFNALVFGVLRWRGRLDHILSRFSKTPLPKVDPAVLNILRVGLFQMTHLDRIPASAAVNTAVNITKTLETPWVAPFVNAVLRKAAVGHAAVEFPPPDSAPDRSLATRHSLPQWLASRWLARYGAEAAERLCESINRIPPLTLRANTLRTGREELIRALAAEAQGAVNTDVAPEAVSVAGLRRRLTELTAFREGWFQVQDESAQLVSLMLAPQPGETVLDACAGRGGKTGHLAQLMGAQGCITAVDRSAARLSLLKEEMQRLGVLNVAPRQWDWEEGPDPGGIGRFDRVLIDAPCSGLGTLRRNPDIKWSASEKELGRHGEIQLRLLERAAACLKPGGVLVYAVCSPEPEETDEVVAAFLARSPSFGIDPDPGLLPPAAAAFLDSRGCLQIYPHVSYMDGFFAVRLKRTLNTKIRLTAEGN